MCIISNTEKEIEKYCLPLYENVFKPLYGKDDFMEEVKIGRVYRHFKGNYYFVENIAYDSETLERIVVYKPLYPRDDNKQIWVRPESMFLSEISIDRPDNVTKQSKRFQLCEEIEKNYIN